MPNPISLSMQLAYNPVFASTSSAVNIGAIDQNTELNTIGTLSPQVPADIYALNFASGSNMQLVFNSLDNTNGGQNLFASDLRVQVLDIAGNVVADSAGTADQQAAYADLTSSTGLAASNGTYYVEVSYAPGTTPYDQNYNFQLTSGTSYSNEFVTNALIQPYDPNLFVPASQSVTPSSNLQLYTRTAVLGSSSLTPTTINVGQLVTNQNELDVTSQANSANPTTDYTFTNQQAGAIKLSFANATDTEQLEVKLLDSNGNVIADSQGTQAQQDAYTELASGAGLEAAAGQYTVEVGFPSGGLVSPQSYNFQLNEGTVYNTIFKTSTAPSTANPNYSAGDNVQVYADSQAQLYTRTAFNQINATPTSAVNIGWLQQNKTSLQVQSLLTGQDNADYYSFALQQGNNLQMSFNNQTDSSALHVQVLNSAGSQVIADNQGTSEQQAAFAQLTSDSGLAANPGQYMVKVSYANGADQSKDEQYTFQLYSGSTYTSLDQTTATAQTVQNLLLSGGSIGFNPASAAASLFTTLQNSSAPLNIFGTGGADSSPFTTNIFA